MNKNAAPGDMTAGLKPLLCPRVAASATGAASPSSIAPATGATTATVFLYAFDLIELNGDDLRRDPLQVRKATLTSVLARAAFPGIRFNEHLEARG